MLKNNKYLSFCFDLDGTISQVEILPLLARELGVEEEIAELTRRTLTGEIAFEASLRQRVSILGRLPLDAVHRVMESLPIDEHIEAFIRKHSDNVAVVTGNLDIWIEPVIKRLGCRAFCSRADMVGGRVRLLDVLDKGGAVKELRREGRTVVAIGESVGDIPMFEAAHDALAFAGVHEPVPQLLSLARVVIRSGRQLCEYLERNYAHHA